MIEAFDVLCSLLTCTKLIGVSLTHYIVVIMISNLFKVRKNCIAQYIYADLINSIICEFEHVIEFIVRNIKRKLNTYDDYTILKEIVKSSRSRAITEVIIIDLRMYLLHHLWAYQDEMIIYLFNDWGAFCSQLIIFKALKIHCIFRKIIQKKALKRSQMCRNVYIMNTSKSLNSQCQLCFLNEFAVNEHTCHRKHDWFSFDITSRITLSVQHSERWNILFRYDLSNIFTYHVH